MLHGLGCGCSCDRNNGMGQAAGPYLTLPQGYSIAGNCNPANGQPDGNATGYALVYGPAQDLATSQCLSHDQIMAQYGSATPAIPWTNPAPLGQSRTTTTTPPVSALPTTATNPVTGTTFAQPTPTASSDLMLGTFDVTSFLGTYWMWLAGGAAALLVLGTMRK